MIPLPDVPSTTHALSLTATWDINPSVALRFGYAYLKYSSADWALGIGINRLNRVTTLGQPEGDYSAHIVGFSTRFRF